MSEITAHVASLALGVVIYEIFRVFTVGPDISFAIAGLVAVVTNFIVGGYINLILFDILGAILGRPISAFIAIKLLGWVLGIS